MRDKEIDFNLGLNQPSAIQSLVKDTLNETANAQGADIYQGNGRLNTSLLIRNAKILLAAGDVALAKNIFRALVESGDSLGIAYAGLGSCYELENKMELAIKSYREAIIYEPTYGSLYALSELYIKRGEHQNAVGTLLRANNLNRISLEQSFEIHKSLGNCYMHMAQLNNAEAHYRKAYEINSASDSLHINIGSLALKKGDISTALLHFKEASRLNTKSPAAYTGIGLAQIGLGNKEAAHEAFAMALRIDIHEVSALYHLVKCSYELKRFDVVCELLNRYIQHNAVNSNILYSYAGILFHRGMLDKALEECEKLLSFKKEHEGAKKLKELILKKLP
jgi:tetratricopeptide (TPR) repeat protein